MTKWFLRSKTLWLNVAAGGGLLAAAQAAASDEVSALGAAVVAPIGNVFLRMITTKAIGSMGKRALSSKTVWFNLALLGGAGLAFAGQQSELGVALGIVAVVNLILRAVTRSRLTAFPHPSRRA